MDLQLKGKTAIVTGGSAGIGLGIVEFLAKEGVEVTVPGRSLKKVKDAVAHIEGNVKPVEADPATVEGATILFRETPKIDILINNLGIYESKAFGDITDDEWMKYFQTNLLGGIRLSRHYLPHMFEQNWGRIIFVSSEAAGETHPDMIHYGVTKTGQVVVARGLAETTKGTRVTVNSVLPGPTRSDTVAAFLRSASAEATTDEQAEKEFFEKHRPTSLIQRMAEASEVASLVTYLASPLAAATNGASIRCEGGILRSLF